MKIGICVSNEAPNLKGRFMKLLQKRINKSSSDWSNKFLERLSSNKIDYGYIYIDRDNWMEQVNEYDLLIWKPKFMGMESSQFFKEKIYFIQYILKKKIFPNYETVWHFDSKVAQKYLFEYLNIKSPKTFVSFDYNESTNLAEEIAYPTVFKKSNGAGSTGVKLLRSKKRLLRNLNYNFVGKKILNNVFKTNHDPFGYLYVQEFLDNNDGDLRINIIGAKYAIGFWRMNRDNDFRASGSGKIDYSKKIPLEIVEYCAKISKENKFDSMAYDILYKSDGDFVIVEISYGFVDTAVYNADGHYILNDNCEIAEYKEGHIWPQDLWVDYVCENIH
jgi:glutathione synthase/RimK-type ligase-like ATP-grasp enzyme